MRHGRQSVCRHIEALRLASCLSRAGIPEGRYKDLRTDPDND